MRDILVGLVLMLSLAVSLVYLVSSAQDSPLPTVVAITPTSTPWGTPPWGDRWNVVACSLRDTARPTPNARGEIVFDGTNTVCYQLPPGDVVMEICEAALTWGLTGCQVDRCKSATECAIEAGPDRRCYFARWYPENHPEWPSGGWVFTTAPDGFPCRPVPWSIQAPRRPYGTPTPP